MKRKTLFLFFILILIISGGVFAQNAQQLRIGVITSGYLVAGSEILYSVDVNELCFLTVETIGELDTWLEAYDSKWNFLAEDDDGGDHYNASVAILVDPGRYYFYLTGYDEYEEGSFRIIAQTETITELRAGSSLRRNITSDDYDLFYYIPARNGVLTIQTSGNTDTFLTLYDTNLEVLAEDDDGAGFPNDRIVNLVTAGSTYFIEVGAYDSGQYTISIRLE